MRSPVFPDTDLVPAEIEPGLSVHHCPRSEGIWIPLAAFLAWKDSGAATNAASNSPQLPPPDAAKRKALLCPESGRLLTRFKVGQGLDFSIERSPFTGGTWLDAGEWDALKGKGLHTELHLISTDGYQNERRAEEYRKSLETTFRQRLGDDDFAMVSEFKQWLEAHPRREEIVCYLTGRFEEPSPEPQP